MTRIGQKRAVVSMKRSGLGLAIAVLLGVACADGNTREDSAVFWGAFKPVAVTELEQYASIRKMTQQADLVVVGIPISIFQGRTWGNALDRVPSVVINIGVSELIAGDLPDPTQQTVSLEIQILSHTEASLREDLGPDGLTNGESLLLPEEASLFFLRDKDDSGTEIGAAKSAYVGNKPYRLVSNQGLISKDNGQAVMPLQTSDPAGSQVEWFASKVEESTFESVLAQARSAVSSPNIP